MAEGLADEMVCYWCHDTWPQVVEFGRKCNRSEVHPEHVWVVPVSAVTEAIERVEEANFTGDGLNFERAWDELCGIFAEICQSTVTNRGSADSFLQDGGVAALHVEDEERRQP